MTKVKTNHIATRISMCIIPIVLASLLSVIFRKYFSVISAVSFFELVKVVIDLEGTMLGFIITAVSILVAFNGSSLTEEVKKTGHFKTVLLVYLVTCFELFISIVYCACILVVNVYNIFITIIFMALLVTAAIYIVLCLFFLSLVVYTLFK